MVTKIFLDSDVILDFLTDRKPFSNSAKRIFNWSEEGRVKLFTSTLAINNVHYVLRKIIGSKKAITVIDELLDILNCIEVAASDLKYSIKSGFTDFENGIQHAIAIRTKGIEAIVTRNGKDYKKSEISVFDPDEILISLRLQ